MTANVGDVERLLRVLVGLLFIGLAFAQGGMWWLGLLGVIPVFTGLMGWCPLYVPFKISTCN